MINLFGLIKMDLRRSIFSLRFFITTVCICVALLINITTDISSTQNDIVYFRMVAHTNSIKLLLVTLSALPYSVSFCHDWNSYYLRNVLVRTSVGNYTASKVLCCAIASGLSAMMGEALFILILMFRFPLVSINAPTHINMLDFPFGQLLQENRVLIYFLSFILFQFAFSALFSVISLFVSVIIPNFFVTVCSPLIIYLIIINLFNKIQLPSFLNPAYIFGGSIVFNSMKFSILYPLLFSFMWILLLGIVIYFNINKKVGESL